MVIDPALRRVRKLVADEALGLDTKDAIMGGAWDDTFALRALVKREREFSDAVEKALYMLTPYVTARQEADDILYPFILPPAKLDPLVEAWIKAWPGDTRAIAEENVAKLKAHMTEIE